MIGLEFFEESAGDARRVLEAMTRLASRRSGRDCVFSLAGTLDETEKARVLQLEVDAFGIPEAAFTRRDLEEVLADPEALFLVLRVDGELHGCTFGYWEWPDQVTVPGTDFYLDSAMVSAPCRGHGIGELATAGVLLLAHLLGCERIGIAAWSYGPHPRRLRRFYGHFGFVQAPSAPGPHTPMMVTPDDALVARWFAELELSPDGHALPTPGRCWPRADERTLIGRFYIALGLAEALYVVAPFEFAYLYLAMARADWAVFVTMAGLVAAMLAATPAGILADRGSRKITVLAGGILSGISLAAVPLAVAMPGVMQLVAASAAFVVLGIGQTLMESVSEAWVVDNLHSVGREDLVEVFYSRGRSVSAAGAAVAGALALVIVLGAVSRRMLDMLWVSGGIGFVVSVLVALRIPERRPAGSVEDVATWPRIRAALRAIGGRRALVMLGAAMVLGAASGAASQEAFAVSLITKQFDARLFAPLSIVDSLMGAIGPIVGIAVARRIGATRMLTLFLLIEAVSTVALFFSGTIGTVLALYVMLDLLDDAWDPVSMARLQALTPSAHRATIGAVYYELAAFAELIAIGAFGLMLGRNRAVIDEATPDLLEAFSGTTRPMPKMPSVWLGLSIPDLAIVIFVGLAALGIPLLIAGGRDGRATANGRRTKAPPPAPAPLPQGSSAAP